MSNPIQDPPVPPGDGGSLDLTGRTLAGFRILRRLGQGGMGHVYLAEQLSLKRKVALKILRPELAANPNALQRFKAEAEAVARATHANIVQVYEFNEADGVVYMALEYVEGRNLREYLARKGAPDLLIAVSIMRQVAAALQRASELGIIHRDIKPENILLTRKGEVKVADFGLARCLAGDQPALNLTQTGVTMGTPLYMSPEQVEGKQVDPRTDIYSFGATCYHMLAGQPPFQGSTAFEVALQHVRTQPMPLRKLRPDLPEGLCAVVHKMMAKAPDQRYQTGRDLLRDVLRLREGLSGTASAPLPTVVEPKSAAATVTPLSSSTATVKPLRKVKPPPSNAGRWLAVAAVASVILAASGGALFGWVQRRNAGPLPPGTVVPYAGSLAPAGVPQRLLHETEQTHRKGAELALAEGASEEARTTGFGPCLNLALLYLEEDRLDEAERLFIRLDKIKKPDAYHWLGHLGQGIVCALRNEPDKSNKIITEHLSKKIIPPPRKVKGKGKGKYDRPSYSPLVIELMNNPRWRYWLSRARWYNKNNGKDIPDVRLRLFMPVDADGPVKAPEFEPGKW